MILNIFKFVYMKYKKTNSEVMIWMAVAMILGSAEATDEGGAS